MLLSRCIRQGCWAHGDRSKTASTDAAEGVQREFAVGGALTNLDVEVALESVEHLLCTTHVAGSTQADVDGVLALGLHGEEAVEGDDTIDARNGDVQLVSHNFLNLGRQVAEFALNLVKHIDNLTGLITERLGNVFDNVDFIFG